MARRTERPAHHAVVTADQMRAVEARLFEVGLPVAALMEKVGGLIARRLQALYLISHFPKVGVLVGPGHNGGDALVVARELYFYGYDVLIFCPLGTAKPLTTAHASYVRALGISEVTDVNQLQDCDLVVDGLFGVGLERQLEGTVARVIDQLNQGPQPIVSIDLPSGLHSDTGEVLGTAVQASRTLCLGLWKLGLLQEQALAYTGAVELIDFNLSLTDIQAGLLGCPDIQRLNPASAIAALPLPRPASTHKYKLGHLLLVGGSQRYAGGIILTALGARASGVGMLSVAVPESLKPILVAQLPEALILGCPETATGAIAQLPGDLDLNAFDAIACGPGLTQEATTVVQQVLDHPSPLVLDADGLNILAGWGPPALENRPPTILTPHAGEFQRLFPHLAAEKNRVFRVRRAAADCGGIVLLKGARVAIATPQGEIWINPESTPALARGGSGDVLTGLMAGLIAQAILRQDPIISAVQTATWWHAQAGILAAQQRSELGVDAFTLTQFLIPALVKALSEEQADETRVP